MTTQYCLTSEVLNVNKFSVKLSDGTEYAVSYNDIIVTSLSSGSAKSDSRLRWSAYGGAEIANLELVIPCIDGISAINVAFHVIDGGDNTKFYDNPAVGQAAEGVSVTSVSGDMALLVNEAAWRNAPPMSLVTFLAEAGVRGITSSTVIKPPADRTEEIIEAINGIEIPSIDTSQITSLADGIKYLHHEITDIKSLLSQEVNSLRNKIATGDKYLDVKTQVISAFRMRLSRTLRQCDIKLKQGDNVIGQGPSYPGSFVLSYFVNPGKDSWTKLHKIVRGSHYGTAIVYSALPGQEKRAIASTTTHFPCVDSKVYAERDDKLCYALGQGVPMEEICLKNRYSPTYASAGNDKEIHLASWARGSGRVRVDELVVVPEEVYTDLEQFVMNQVYWKLDEDDWLQKKIDEYPEVFPYSLWHDFQAEKLGDIQGLSLEITWADVQSAPDEVKLYQSW